MKRYSISLCRPITGYRWQYWGRAETLEKALDLVKDIPISECFCGYQIKDSEIKEVVAYKRFVYPTK